MTGKQPETYASDGTFKSVTLASPSERNENKRVSGKANLASGISSRGPGTRCRRAAALDHRNGGPAFDVRLPSACAGNLVLLGRNADALRRNRDVRVYQIPAGLALTRR